MVAVDDSWKQEGVLLISQAAEVKSVPDSQAGRLVSQTGYYPWQEDDVPRLLVLTSSPSPLRTICIALPP